MMKSFHVVAFGSLCSLLLCLPLRAQDKPVDTAPKWNAYIRAWHQSDLSSGAALPSQFLIKEARFGVNGSINEYASYKLLVDVAKITTLSSVSGTVPNSTADKTLLKSASASGTDVLQDAAVDITPTKALTLSMGQFKVPFSTDNNRSGAVADFANRPFITYVSPIIRDLGFMTGYKIGGVLPAELYGGLFNGTGADKKENDKTTDYVVRGVVRPLKDLGVSANYYGGQAGGGALAMTNFGADYKLGALFLDGEFGMKSLDSLANARRGLITTKSNSYFAYATYTLSFENMMVTNITPGIRYDAYDPDNNKAGDDVSRITVGLTVTFAKISFAHIRLNYEKFNYKDPLIKNPDTFVAELQTRF